MRTFIGIPLGEEVKKELYKLQQDILGAAGNYFKTTPVKDFHITLKFLGEITDKEAKEIEKALERIAPKKVELNFGKIGFFPTFVSNADSGNSQIKIVWIGLEPEKEICELEKSINTILKGFKDIKNEYDFHPHITLFRVKFIKDKHLFLDATSKIVIPKIISRIDSFILYKSILTPDGSVYEALREYT